jgi:hypothetical protein
MSNATLGSLEKVDAFEVLRVLVLSGSGHNPSTGWKNWLAPTKDLANTYDFLQEKPTGYSAPIVLPFTVHDSFPGHGESEVVVRDLEAGKPTEKRIPVRRATVTEEAALLQLIPKGLQRYLSDHGAEPRPTPEAGLGPISYSHYLGGINVPFGCATLRNPLRSRHYDFTLVVEVGTPQDVGGAVLDCLKTTAIAAALAILLTPIGWAAEIPVLESLLTACLAQKLRDLIRVNIEVSNHCN